ncbi:hypothetical protein [Actinoplanes regularis]|uniref:hypothetical protein n=1 Tax=Actinoplanes regularis TaxID=52697 RepID=UPI002552515D|nr:hypothetical protein [Actinoplanes regularis]
MEIRAGDIIVAERVADIMSNYGYAEIDEEKAVDLAALLCAFLHSEGVRTCPEEAEKYAREAGIYIVSP